MIENCPICKAMSNPISINGKDAISIICGKCGVIEFTRNAYYKLISISLKPRQQANLIGWLSENPHLIYETEIEKLCILSTPNFHDRAIKLLKLIEVQTEYAGHFVPKNNTEWIKKSWCINGDELAEVLNYLVSISVILGDDRISTSRYKITPSGWAQIERLRSINAESMQCFVAMWFDTSMNLVYDNGILKGVEDAGYKSHRVDKREHNDKIDDEIIAQIRQSKFMIADFTGHRGGVYFEAGFAKGLGLEVIWTCRKDDLPHLHFDIRQYNCITWENDKLNEFTKGIKNRIEAVIGRGNFKPSTRNGL